MYYLIFKDRATADALLAETPFGPESGVILKVGPAPDPIPEGDPNADFLEAIGEPGADTNRITYCEGADGRVFLNPVYLTDDDALALKTWHASAIASHGLSEKQVKELQAWVPAKVQVLDKLPEGWKAKVVDLEI